MEWLWVSLFIVVLTGVIWLLSWLKTSEKAEVLVDKNKFTKESGYSIENQKLQKFIGHEGIVTMDLKPVGYIEIEGYRLEAKSDGNYLSPGTPVEVLKIVENTLIVKEKKS